MSFIDIHFVDDLKKSSLAKKNRPYYFSHLQNVCIFAAQTSIIKTTTLMNKFLRFFFVALLGFVSLGNAFADDKTDELTWEGLGLVATNSNYTAFSDKSFNSPAVYAGTASSGTGKYIQLRSNKSDAGIVTTKSGGKLKSVTIAFNSSTTDRAIDIYGKNEPYEVGPDMYDDNKKGELIGSIAANDASFTVTPEVSYKYLGMVAHNGAIYIDKITVVWEEPQGEVKTETVVELSGDYLTRFTPGKDGDETELPTAVVKADDVAVEGAGVKWSLKMGSNWIMGEEEPSIGDGKVYIPNHSCGDLTLTAKYEGDDTYEASSKSYTLKVYKGYMNIRSILEDFPEVGGDTWKGKEAEWNKGYLTSFWEVMPEGDGNFLSQQALVTYVNGSYTYIKDDIGCSLLLYGSGLGFKQGDIISGDFGNDQGFGAIYGTLKSYNGLLELAVNKEDVEFVVKSSDNPVEPRTIVLGELDQSCMNEFVRIEYAEFVAADGKNLTFKIGDETLAVYNQWNLKIDDEANGLKAGTKYNLEGMGCIYWKNQTLTNQLYLTKFEERKSGDTGIKNLKLTISHDGEVFTESFPASGWQNKVIEGETSSLKILKAEVETSKPMKYVGFIATMYNAEDGWQHDENAWRTIDFQNQGDGTWVIDMGEGAELVESEWLNKNKTKTFEFLVYAEDEAGTPIHYNNGGQDKNYKVTFTTGGNSDPDAIDDVKIESRKSATYNLSGQPVNRTYRGIVIQNARKVLRK